MPLEPMPNEEALFLILQANAQGDFLIHAMEVWSGMPEHPRDYMTAYQQGEFFCQLGAALKRIAEEARDKPKGEACEECEDSESAE